MAEWNGLGRYPEDADVNDRPEEGTLLAYVDGSYQDALKKYGFGCIFILPDGRIYTEYGNGDNPDSLKQRNVSGEMLGAMYAVRFALNSGFTAIEIRYDYEGIEKWVTGAWKSKNDLTKKYAQTMLGWGQKIQIRFTKVPAHSKVKYNELQMRPQSWVWQTETVFPKSKVSVTSKRQTVWKRENIYLRPCVCSPEVKGFGKE